VICVTKHDDYDATGRWDVTYQEKSKEPATVTYDGVFVANSRNQQIYRPKLEGLENFGGRIFDSQSFKQAEGFENRRILI
uniref:Flavin-containing monooxygenase n=1 Tax=Romanomermis culicivorax TaxID=13658 RepID=A0A915KAE7_ROMCU